MANARTPKNGERHQHKKTKQIVRVLSTIKGMALCQPEGTTRAADTKEIAFESLAKNYDRIEG